MEAEAVASRCEKLIETLLAATAEARPQLAEAGNVSWGNPRVSRREQCVDTIGTVFGVWFLWFFRL